MSTGNSPSQESACLRQREIQSRTSKVAGSQGQFAPIDEPTEWVSQFVVAVEKSGELRVCIDPKALNVALKRERYQIPVIDELLPDLAEAHLFTKVDLTSAFWHLVLDDESSLLTAFATPHGKYHWLCLLFGLFVK